MLWKNILALVAGGALAVGAATVSAQQIQSAPSPPEGTAPAPSTAQDAICPQGTPLDASQLAGDWSDERGGAPVTIVSKTSSDPTTFTLQGAHSWDGAYANGKLVFTRKPSADEMAHDAPEWARKAVENKLEWSLELTAVLTERGKDLCGPWYPGLVKVESANAGDGATQSAGNASIAGKGSPIVVHYTSKPAAIYRVVVLDNQTGFATQGVPYHPYPYPLPLRKVPRASAPEEYSAFFYATNPYLTDTERDSPTHFAQYTRAPNGNRYIPNETRMLYVVGHGLPRDFKGKLDVEAGLGSAGLDYSIVATSHETPSVMGPQYMDMFRRGQAAALLNVDDPETRDMIEHGDAVLIHVGLNSSVLPGYKDFKVNDIGGNTEWRLRFGDDRAILSFGRDTAYGEPELTDGLFLPERTFIEVHTEAPLPVESIPLRVVLNGNPIKWNGADTIVAQRVPDDATGTVYRTATIELVEQGNPQGPADPGVVFLPAKVGDRFDMRLDDPGLFAAQERPAIVQRTPAALGLMWKEALQRAAKVAGIDVTDWNQLSGQKASEISNIVWTRALLATTTPGLMAQAYNKVGGWFGAKPITAPINDSTSVTVGDQAALIMFRDEFLRRMKQSIADNALPQIKDDADLRGLRQSLKPQAWDAKSAWAYIYVACPKEVGGATAVANQAGGESCAYSYALDDDWLKKTFGDNEVAADAWALKATADALQKYKDAADDTLKKLEALKDDDAEGMLDLLAADCVPEPLDLPCGYKALRPSLLPRMMKLADLQTPQQRHLWVADLNGRYELRNLYSLISAVKAQKQYAQADRQMAIMLVTSLTAPFLSELGAFGEIASAAMDSGAVSIVTLATEIPEYIRVREEIKFAQGASLVLGQERLSAALTAESQFYNELLTTIGMSLGTEALAMHGSVAHARAAAVETEIKQLKTLAALKKLAVKDQAAVVHAIVSAKILQETGNVAAMGQFERELAAAGDDLVASGAAAKAESAPALNANAETAPVINAKGETPAINAKGETAPVFAEATAEDQPVDPLKAEHEPDLMNERPSDAAPETPEYSEFEAGEMKLSPADKARLASQAEPTTGSWFEGVWDGKVTRFRLGERLGEKSAYAKVYDLLEPKLPGCEDGCVIKIYGVSREEAAAARDIVRGSELLGNDILQPRLIGPETTSKAPMPFLIQEKLKFGKPGDCTLCFFAWNTEAKWDAAAAAFHNDPALGDALLELFGKISKKGLVWTDGNLPNMYFQKVGNGWVAGVLDSDFIAPIYERSGRLAKYFGHAEWEAVKKVGSLASTREATTNTLMNDWLQSQAKTFPTNPIYRKTFESLSAADQQNVLSAFELQRWKYFEANPGPYFPDTDFFMEKMLEKKDFIHYNPVTDEWTGIFIDSGKPLDRAKFKKWFPKMFDRNRIAPIDGSNPFFKSEIELQGNVIKFADARAARRPAAANDGDWYAAA